jgi:hypothetical protein
LTNEEEVLVERALKNIDTFFGKIKKIEESGGFDNIFDREMFLEVCQRIDEKRAGKAGK